MGNKHGKKKQARRGGGGGGGGNHIKTTAAAAAAAPPPPPPGAQGGSAGAGHTVHIHRRYSHVAHNGGEHAIGLNSFEIMKVLGKGSFGKVMLVRKKDTHKIFAMPVKRTQL